MLSLVLLTLTATSEPPPTDVAPRQVAVFAQPLITVAGLVGFADPGALVYGLALSGGVQVNAAERWGLTIDFAATAAGAGSSESIRGVQGGAFSIGPTFRVTGKGLSGIFVTPKGYATLGNNWTDFGPSPLLGKNDGFTSWRSFEVGAGVDLAVQWTSDRFFIGSVIGIGGGYAFGAGSPVSSFSSTVIGSGFAARGGPVFSLNLHLLRIGMTF